MHCRSQRKIAPAQVADRAGVSRKRGRSPFNMPLRGRSACLHVPGPSLRSQAQLGPARVPSLLIYCALVTGPVIFCTSCDD